MKCPTCGRTHNRSSQANRRYWSMLNQIAEQIKTADGKYSPDTWHEYFKQRYLGCDDITLPNRKVITQGKSTTELDVREFGEYMENVEYWATEHGAILNFDET